MGPPLLAASEPPGEPPIGDLPSGELPAGAGDARPFELPSHLPSDDALRLPPWPPWPDDTSLPLGARPMDHPLEAQPIYGDGIPFHLGVLGVTPLLTAMLLVELLAAAVPRWRQRRHGGPEARRPLVWLALVLAAILGVLQAYGVAIEARGMGIAAHGTGPTLAIIALSLLGLALLVPAMWLSSRYGVANGFAVVVVFLAIPIWLPQLLHTWGAEDRERAWHFILLGVGATLAVLSLRPDGRRLPLSGLLPLTVLIQLAALVALLGTLVWPPLMEAMQPPATLRTVLIGVLAVGMPWLALRRRAHARRSPSGEARHSLALSAAYIAVLYLANEAVAPNPSLLAIGQEFILIATATAASWDLLAELAARWHHGALVTAWPFHDSDAAERVAAALTARGVPVFLRTQRLHTLVRILGPWFPTELMVPPAAVGLARQLAETDHAQPALAAAAEALA